MSRYAYALFFGVMTGGVSAGIGGVVVGALSDDASWAPAASGAVGLALGLVVFAAVMRASAEPRD